MFWSLSTRPTRRPRCGTLARAVRKEKRESPKQIYIYIKTHCHHSLSLSSLPGIRAAFESLSAGATYLAERGTYYASDAYDKSKAVAVKTLDQAKTYGATAVEEAKVFGEKVKTQSTEAYHAAAEKAGEVYEVAKDKAAVAAAQAQDAAGKVADKATEAYNSAAAAARK